MNSHREFLQIAERYGSPFYLFDRAAFERNFVDLQDAFARHYPEVVVGYSYKTNYLPYLCRLAHSLGGFAEVVSRLELELALRLGCPPTEIIYNGPVKEEDDLAFALGRGVLVNLDTVRELESVLHLAARQPLQTLRIGLRINIPLTDEQGVSHVQEAFASGRFGFTPEMLETALPLLAARPNLQVVALHGHASSSDRSLWVYRSIAARLCAVATKYFADTLAFLDIGGGFYGRPVPAMGLTEVPDYSDYAAAVGAVLQGYPWLRARGVRLVVEPGMALVADALNFVTRVFEVKEVGARQLAVVDGSVFHVKPTMHGRNHPFALIKAGPNRAPRRRYCVVGATCMEKDRLLQEVESDNIERGDFIRVENVGAYTVVLTPPFIHPAPAILLREPGGLHLLRRRQSFDEFFASYLPFDAEETP